MSVEIVTVMNRWPDPVRESYYKPQMFFKSLERFGVKPTLLGLNEPWGGLMTKPRRLRQWLREGKCKSDVLIACDSFDIVFVAPPEEVEGVYRGGWGSTFAKPIVFNAEKGIFPRGELAHKFDDVPGPWKYLNSGFMIGDPGKILALLESMWLDDIHDDHKGTGPLDGGAGTWVNPNDQGHYQYAYAAQVVQIVLDHQCEICQTLSACTLEEFDLTGSRIKNVATGTEPLVHHANGSGKNDLLPIFLKHWGLD